MIRRYVTVLTMVFGAYAPIPDAKEVNVLSFSFEVPDHWVVQGNGQAQVMAIGAPDGSKFPVVIASGCIPSESRKCVEPPIRRSGPQPGAPNEGCAQAIAQEIVRSDRIEETRWICLPVSSGALKVETGISLFSVDGSFLTVWYVANAQDGNVAAVLEAIGRSVTLRQ